MKMSLGTTRSPVNATSTPKLKVIALVSGGKDSIFSILHCLANGHEVVALANLYPEEQEAEDEDIDSYMYQTVGHSVIPLYSEALGLPLFRQAITGTAANSRREYAPQSTTPSLGVTPVSNVSNVTRGNEEDETESLIPLLQRIKEALPGANAVSTGAILSTYQRTRVESVAIRLGLVPLSFLWQYPYLPPYRQSSLLEDMRNVGQDSRIIKVASGGLDESFLWKDVADEKTVSRLKKVMQRFGGGEGGAVLGEGGEFETLAISGPAPLWKGRIEVGEVKTVKRDGGTAVVQLKRATVVPDEDILSGTSEGLAAQLRIPNLLDDEFAKVYEKLIAVGTKAKDGEEDETAGQPTLEPFVLEKTVKILSSIANTQQSGRRYQSNGSVHISNIMNPIGTVAEQMKTVMTKLQSHLQVLQRPASSVLSSTLLLRDMDDFTTINPVYGSIFTDPTPPSRVTVACGSILPFQTQVILSVVIDVGDKSRRNGLHVQSRSYWAPANIGPYSQAISMPVALAINYEDGQDGSMAPPRLVSIAGQIPLVSASMEVVTLNDTGFDGESKRSTKERAFILQTVLSLQHMWRIGRTMEVSWWTAGLAFISDCSPEEGDQRANIVTDAWRFIHSAFFDGTDTEDEEFPKEADEIESEEDEEEEVVDVWDQKYRSGAAQYDAKEMDSRRLLPDYEKLHPNLSTFRHPFCFIAQVSQLPRAASVEWASIGFADTSVKLSSGTQGSTVTAHARETDCEFYYRTIRTTEQLVELSDAENKRIDDVGAVTGGRWRNSWTVYTITEVPEEVLRTWEPLVVPCKRIWSGGDRRGASEVVAVVVIRREAYPPTM
jgi:diphthine-ammonia ligase